jgi:hypothetical protein
MLSANEHANVVTMVGAAGGRAPTIAPQMYYIITYCCVK